MRTKANVVMLPTEDATGLSKQTMDLWGVPKNGKLEFTDNATRIRNNHLITNRKAATTALDKYEFYHLYLTIDDPNVIEDWIVWKGDVYYLTATGSLKGTTIHPMRMDIEKIIATTDPKLSYEVVNEVGDASSDRLPQIPASFIRTYAESQGSIKDVDVETDSYYTKGNYSNVCSICKEEFYNTDKLGFVCPKHDRVKLTPENEVIISLVEEKVYSRTELIDFMVITFEEQRTYNHKTFEDCKKAVMKYFKIDKI